MFPHRPSDTSRSTWTAEADCSLLEFRWPWLVVLLIGLGGTKTATADEPVDYLRQIKPVLKQRCYSCHGALRHRAKLRVDTAELLRRGGVSGQVVEPGDAEASLLMERVCASDLKLRMPPEGAPLSSEQIESLRAWIDQGAKVPAEESPEEDPRQHWAFLKPQKPTVPTVEGSEWCRNPIDAFLATEHQRRGLKPLAPASPEVLIRRLYIDLVGLPPTREQLHEFLDDPSDTSYERIVDRLLASPQHGERWARHWMDVWRYSDWYGRRAVPDVLNSYAMIWRWRDWIVASLNRDKGYDEMVRQMLAADELNPTDDENLVATGYIVRNFYRWNYNSWMKDNVEHTAKAFLGLTVQCAHCHDHKYDPIRQEDYFALRACFEPIEIRHDRVPGEPDPGAYPKYVYGSAYRPITSGMVRVFDEKLDATTLLYTRGESRNVIPNKPPIAPGVPAFLESEAFRVEPVKLPAEAAHPGLKNFVRHEEIDRRIVQLARCERTAASGSEPERKVAEAERIAARAELDAILARQAADLVRFGKQPGDGESLGQAAAQRERRAEQSRLRLALEQAKLQLSRVTQKPPAGSKTEAELIGARKALQTTQAATEAALGSWHKKPGPYTPLSPSYPERSTGRRTALARWITSTDNPLTARVAVNHLWRWHFQQPLVATTYDFGRNGKRPANPALLDWLACELIDRGWSMKQMHRLIVTSAAYRMSSHAANDDPNRQRDPENRFCWRFNSARMESEVVRDSLLASAGSIDQTMQGPDIDFQEGFRSHRRSLYLTHHGEGRMPFLELFDAPDACEAYTRTVSVVPQQSLALANNELARTLSAAIANRLREEIGNDSQAVFVAAAFEQVLSRKPTPAEMQRSLSFLESQERLFGSNVATRRDSAARACGNLVHVLFNHHDFLTIH